MPRLVLKFYFNGSMDRIVDFVLTINIM